MEDTRAETNRALAAAASTEGKIIAEADIKAEGREIIRILIIITMAAMEIKTDMEMAMAMAMAMAIGMDLAMTIGRDLATAADMEPEMEIIIMMGAAKAGATITAWTMAMATTMVARKGDRVRIETPIRWSAT